jgi:hypothetical protein
LSYRRRSSKRYDARKAARLWIRIAKSLREGKGIPPRTPYYPNPYGVPIVKPKTLRGLSLDPATAMVTAGFYLFGPHWPRVYEKIEVRDKRGRRRKLPNNLIYGRAMR